MGYWAQSPQVRGQMVLIATSLDDRIPEDHSVRVVAEILEGYDWSPWENRYDGKRGQPPIHPSILAGVWLYALRLGVRSSRKLEYMVSHNIDFMWLARGHTPDHSTLSQFRAKFGPELKDLFRHVVRVAMAAGLLELVDVALDGTRVKANNSRYQTWTAASIAAALETLSQAFEKMLAESQAADQHDDGMGSISPDKMREEMQNLQTRQAALKAIQERLKEADAARKKEGMNPQKNPAQIPRHDPDSKVLPNKEGGYAPNYTPMIAAEGRGGFIVDADVLASANENTALLPTLEHIAETCGQKPDHILADGAYATGSNIVATQAIDIEFFSNLPLPAVATNPAIRPDPTQPVAEADLPQLPISPQSRRFDKACFVYDREKDIYYCPQGKPLPFEETKSDFNKGEKTSARSYRCAACEGCPLKPRCVSDANKAGRTISRDSYADEREVFARKMQTEDAQETYHKRMHIGETPFALIKHVMGLRQFLLRGLDQVKVEWMWAATAVNLNKLARGVLRRRAAVEAQLAVPAAE